MCADSFFRRRCIANARRRNGRLVRISPPTLLRATPPLLVIAYHSVRPNWSHPLSVTPERFRAQLSALAARGCHGVTLSEAVRAGAGLAVTFDDAFASVARWAAPVLDELGWPATVFVPTTAVTRGERLAWLAESDPGDEFAPLTWQELERLHAAGWEIGSHSCTHRRLSLLDDDELRRELVESRETILERVGSCTSVSYPWGEVDARVVEAAQRAGYSIGTGLVGRFKVGNHLRVPRSPISANDGAIRFWFKTSCSGFRIRASRVWPAFEQIRSAAGSAAAALPRLTPETLLRKTRQRLYSDRYSIGLAVAIGAHETAEQADVAVVSVVEPLSFPELASLTRDASDADYLFLRAMERTRVAAAGNLVVARAADGTFAGAHFVHPPSRQRALAAVAPGLYPPLDPGDVLTEALYTAPAFRGRGVAAAMLSSTLDLLRATPARRALAYVDVENCASLRAFHRVGFRPTGDMRVDRFRLGRFESEFRPLDRAIEQKWLDAVGAKVSGHRSPSRPGPP